MNFTKLNPAYEITVTPAATGPSQFLGTHPAPGGLPQGTKIRLARIKRKRRTK